MVLQRGRVNGGCGRKAGCGGFRRRRRGREGVPPPQGVGRPLLWRGRNRLGRRHGHRGSQGPAGPGGRPALCCLGQHRDLGPAAAGLAVALAGATDLGVLRGIGTEVALDDLARQRNVPVGELGAV